MRQMLPMLVIFQLVLIAKVLIAMVTSGFLKGDFKLIYLAKILMQVAKLVYQSKPWP